LAKTKRVHQIAKELGVPSKAVVEKCQAEGVPGITNHMSTVKIGLAQTITEWFSEEHQTETAVESAGQVDVDQARETAKRRSASSSSSAAKAKRPASRASAQAGGASGSDSDSQGGSTAVIDREPPRSARARRRKEAAKAEEAEQVARVERARKARRAETRKDEQTEQSSQTEQTERQARPSEAAESGRAATTSEDQTSVEPTAPAAGSEDASPQSDSAPSAAATGEAESTGAEASDSVESGAGESVKPVGEVNVPERPEVVKPAGSKLEQPKEAKLKGPRVIRVEKPDPVAPPRPRQPGGGQSRSDSSSGTSLPTGGGVPGITRSKGPQRGRGAGAAPEPESAADKKRRSLTSRRGRYAQSLPTGPTKFTEADLAELDAKLNRSAGYVKQRRRDLRKSGHAAAPAASPVVTGGKVEIAEPITIKDLSAATGIKSADIIKYLFKKGVMATINSAIDNDAAEEIALEYNIELVVKAKQTAEQEVLQEFEQREEIDVHARPPVVTVLGHVDHGKTSLLDKIRAADVADHEAGGITQHVGAYRVSTENPDGKQKTVVFLDTPGHEAFTTMRARGANLTDLVVLVVAADDGVMPQTIESINHAKAAGVPIIVALNKIDTPQATDENIHKIYGQLSEHGLNPVEWGGETEIIKTSAETGQGVKDLIEMLDFQAELLELKADYGGPARGTVIEAEMQPGRGPVARVLVEQGHIRVGDFIVIGRSYGRVRDMTDDRGRSIREAGPATPLELSGIDEVPDAGDKFYITQTLQRAEQVATQYRENEREEQLARQNKVTLDNFADQLQAGKQSLLRVVLKADVHGSLDVLRKSLEELGNEEVAVRVLHSAVGAITESDVLLADASDAVIIGFHVVANTAVREIAEERKVDIRLYRVIYDVTNDVTKALEGMLDPEKQEEQIGVAEVKETFKITKVGTVAGCVVSEGQMNKAMKLRVVREGSIVTDERKFESLRRVKEDVSTVRAGTECGIRIAGFDDVKPGDQIVCYNTVNVARKLG